MGANLCGLEKRSGRGLEKQDANRVCLQKVSLAIITLLCVGIVHAGRSIKVVNHQGDMQKLGYTVQACETGSAEHCGSMRIVRAAQADPVAVGKQDAVTRIVVKKLKDGEGKKLRMRASYDVSFYVNGEK